ncbi:MAG: NUDIX domain-containing protein [Candidatus Saccharibacteria bacterium]|nr:NUDIX domain-containing protein [Candidatus Saccharibacteria bacterium]
MSDIEYFDVVDENDRPNGEKTTKAEAHEHRIIHRCAAVFVFNQNGNLYVQEHLKHNNKLDHTVGGHVSAGEDYETAAYREMAEEIGLSGVKLQEVATGYYSDEGVYIHMFGIFKCTAPKAWEFTPNDEVEVIYPMPVEKIVKQMQSHPEKFTGGFINTMKKYLGATSEKS